MYLVKKNMWKILNLKTFDNAFFLNPHVTYLAQNWHVLYSHLLQMCRLAACFLA